MECDLTEEKCIWKDRWHYEQIPITSNSVPSKLLLIVLPHFLPSSLQIILTFFPIQLLLYKLQPGNISSSRYT